MWPYIRNVGVLPLWPVGGTVPAMQRLLVLLVVLSGCAPTFAQAQQANAAEAQRRWALSPQALVGRPIADAYARWGVPTGQSQAGAGWAYQWETFGATHAVAGGGRYVVGGSSWQEHCRRWVVTDAQGVIQSANTEGECR